MLGNSDLSVILRMLILNHSF